jgi:hypothetical protein
MHKQPLLFSKVTAFLRPRLDVKVYKGQLESMPADLVVALSHDWRFPKFKLGTPRYPPSIEWDWILHEVNHPASVDLPNGDVRVHQRVGELASCWQQSFPRFI